MGETEERKLMYSGEEVNQILFEVTLRIAKAEEKLKKIEYIVNEWKESVEWDIEMLDTLEEIQKVLEKE